MRMRSSEPVLAPIGHHAMRDDGRQLLTKQTSRDKLSRLSSSNRWMARRMKQAPIFVRQTFSGRGVFAARSFETEELVCRIDGRVVPDDGCGSEYCMDFGDRTLLEPAEPYCFLNHSCEPNCELIVWEDEEAPLELCLHAVREIEPGEELTIDYAWPADSAIPCECRSQLCRGWIVAEQELPYLTRQKQDSASPQTAG